VSRPSGSSRGQRRASAQRAVSLAHQRLIALTRELTAADSDLSKKSGAALQKHIKRRLSVQATFIRKTTLKMRGTLAGGVSVRAGGEIHGTKSRGAPAGESPRMRTGALRRGIKNTVVDGVRQVRAENFKSKIHEFGFVASASPAGTYKRGRRKGQAKPPRAARSAPPRPFMRPGFEDAKPEMARLGATVLSAGVRANAERLGG
jgi:hypothetical protein